MVYIRDTSYLWATKGPFYFWESNHIYKESPQLKSVKPVRKSVAMQQSLNSFSSHWVKKKLIPLKLSQSPTIEHFFKPNFLRLKSYSVGHWPQPAKDVAALASLQVEFHENEIPFFTAVCFKMEVFCLFFFEGL